MQDDVQPMQPRPQGPQTASTNTVFPNSQSDQFGAQPNAPTEPVTPLQSASNEAPTPVVPEKKKGSAAKWVVIAVLALLVGALAGYIIGGNMAKTDATASYEAQISSLQTDLDKANATIKSGVTGGTQAMTTLQEENADLKATNTQLTAQVADLQKQLEEAKKDDTAPTTP